MPSVNRVFSLLIVSSLAVLAGCGGGGSRNIPTPPPSGGFLPSDLNGTYVFSTSGVDTGNQFLMMVGTFSANGSGGITGGTVDINDARFGTPVVGLAITGGTYSVTSDGRGQARLSARTPFSNSIGLDFVLSSNSHGLLTEFDPNGTGSGTLDLQSAVTQAQLAGSYAFNLSGIDTSAAALGTVGSFTLGANGTITAGIQDFNDANAFTSLPLSGSVAAGTGGAPGGATLTTSGTLGTLTFDVFPIDSTHLKFIETAGSSLLAGDAFTQQGAALPTTPTTFAFSMAGGGSAGPLAVGGLMPLNGTGTIGTGALVDINEPGIATSGPLGFTGSYAASGTVGGRTLFNVSGFSVAAQFVAYPTTSAGLQILESDSTGFLDGVALAQQSGATLAASQGYAVGLSAANLTSGVEEDDVAEFTNTGGAFSGLIDFNDQGTLAFDQKLNGSYTMDTPATGRGTLTSNDFNGVFYAVDSSTALFLETDGNQIGSGIFQVQNAAAPAAVAPQPALGLRPVARRNHMLSNR